MGYGWIGQGNYYLKYSKLSTSNADNCTIGNSFIFGSNVQATNISSGSLYINNISLLPSNGDIFQERIFLANNNQSSYADITGFNFSNSITRYCEALVTVNIITLLGEITGGYTLQVLQSNNKWKINHRFIGDQNIGFKFYITNTGQIQYTSINTNNWISTTLHFRGLALNK